ncbi:MAG TPA: type III pantothenate kinase [Chitinophagaceae bacterium]|nr:type III pantothenate kinase [Chitinophagaceae bacterium]
MAQTTICFDFGNTRLKYALFTGNQQTLVAVLENDAYDTVKAVLDTYKPDKAILSSVINHNVAIESLLASSTRFHKLSHQTKLPFTTPVGKPETIGADRLALCAAAVEFFPEKNNLVIALGTCITYNFINKYHEFTGGGISPGMDMRFKSLNTFTALLPVIKEDWNFPLIGYDTRTNILSGVILGMAKEIDGFIDAYSARYGNFNVLLTGGNSAYFVPHLKNQIFADPDLLFKGLYAISECNNQT